MGKGPSIIACLDGIDGVGKSSAASLLSAFMGIPTITGGRKWDNTPWPVEVKKNTDLLIMNTLHQLGEHLPSIIMDRCYVSTIVYNPETSSMRDVPWEIHYPVERTVFITIVDDIRACIERESLHPYTALLNQRENEQRGFLEMSQWLGHRGYRTAIVNASPGVMYVADAIRTEIRNLQMSILESERSEE